MPSLPSSLVMIKGVADRSPLGNKISIFEAIEPFTFNGDNGVNFTFGKVFVSPS